MSDLKEPGFKSSGVIESLGKVFAGLSEKDKQAEIRKNKAIFELLVKNKEGQSVSWVIDLKKEGTITKGKPTTIKPDVTIIMEDDLFLELAEEKTTGQQAWLTGKLKTKGNMMLATKLDGVLRMAKTKAKL